MRLKKRDNEEGDRGKRRAKLVDLGLSMICLLHRKSNKLCCTKINTLPQLTFELNYESSADDDGKGRSLDSSNLQVCLDDISQPR